MGQAVQGWERAEAGSDLGGTGWGAQEETPASAPEPSGREADPAGCPHAVLQAESAPLFVIYKRGVQLCFITWCQFTSQKDFCFLT